MQAKCFFVTSIFTWIHIHTAAVNYQHFHPQCTARRKAVCWGSRPSSDEGENKQSETLHSPEPLCQGQNPDPHCVTQNVNAFYHVASRAFAFLSLLDVLSVFNVKVPNAWAISSWFKHQKCRMFPWSVSFVEKTLTRPHQLPVVSSLCGHGQRWKCS